jgi:hypothetical protein
MWYPRDGNILGISDGRGYAVTLPEVILIDTGISDKCAIQGQLTTLANDDMSIVFRSDSVDPKYLEVENEGASYILAKGYVGNKEHLVTYSTTPVSGDIIRVELNGTQITVYLNGAVIIQREERDYLGFPSHGFRVSNTSQRFDDFKFEVRL